MENSKRYKGSSDLKLIKKEIAEKYFFGIDKEIAASKDIFMILQVHDELLFEIKDSLVKKTAPEIRKIMEGVISPKETRGIVCMVDVSAGDNWGEMVRFAQS